jgi:cyclophilin family peptidyl-prolyl cis-trans isomerase
VKHDDVGILAMATNGEPHTAATQFYITLAPLPWLDGKRVAFGKVLTLEGLQTLRKIENVMLNNERPVPELTISEAMVLHTSQQI